MSTNVRLVFGILMCALASAQVRDDTARLAAVLKTFRAYKAYQFQPDDYRRIQTEYLTWIDVRMTHRITPEQMNQELQAAGLLSEGAQTIEGAERSFAGFLGPIATPAAGIPKDLLAVTFGIYMGNSCGYDETVAIYTSKSFRRVAVLNAKSDRANGSYLRSIVAGRDEGANGRLIASAWVFANCTSQWNGNTFRIDRLRRGSLQTVLEQGEAAYEGDPVEIQVQRDSVTFTWGTTSGFLAATVRLATKRYRIQGNRAIREAPFAPSYGSLIDEWLDLNDSEAAPLATPALAARHRDLAARRKKDTFEWTHAADCSGPPATREIALEWDESKETTVFQIAGSTPRDMRIVSVTNQRSPSCKEIDISKDLLGIVLEPSR